MNTPVSPNWFDQTPDSAFLRERQLIGDWRDPYSPRLIPISRATLWRLVKNNKFPVPQKIGPNTTAWNCGEVRAWLIERNEAARRGAYIKVAINQPPSSFPSLLSESPRQTRALSTTVSRSAPHNHQPPLQAEHSPGAKNALPELPIVDGTKTNAVTKRSCRAGYAG